MPHAARTSEETNQRNPFLRKLGEVVEQNLQNEQFSVEALAEQMHMSRSNLHRKLKQTTGQTANQFIREYRLERAVDLLKKDDRPISEVAYEVGFSSPSYFTSCFTEHYGYPPGEAKFRTKESETSPEDPDKGNTDGFKLPTKLLAMVGLVAIGLLVVISLVEWQSADPESQGVSTANDQSVAVLPLRNLNVDQEYEYFSEGVVQAINRHLSQIEDLKVISLTSTDRYRESDLSAQEIGKELQVANLLEGSIQRQENTVRIEVRLVDASNGRQIWAENYDREWKDILQIQSEIARDVASVLKATLSQEEKAELNQNVNVSPEAYDLYLKGLYEGRSYTRNGIHNAIENFQQAIAVDPNFAPAYSGAAQSYIGLAAIFGTELSALDAFTLAKPFIDKALELDPDLAEAHTWNAFYLLYNNWDFAGAEQEYQKAIVNIFPDALAVYADFLHFTRRHNEGLEIAKRLQDTDPFYPNTRMILSLYYTGQYQEAEDFTQERMKMFNNYFTLDSYGFFLLNTGKYEEAISMFQRVRKIEDIRYPRMLGWMGAAYAHSGQPEKAQELIDELRAKLTTNDAGSIRFFIAAIYSALRDKTTALQWLQQAYEEHEMEMPWLISEPQFYNLHSEPEFQQLVEAVGFPAYSMQ